MTLGSRTFLGVFLASALALTVSTVLVERSLRTFLYNDIRLSLLGQARLAASLLAEQPTNSAPDVQADDIGASIHTRVTLIAEAGRVVGDSEVAFTDLAALENHASREEIAEARRMGEGTFVRLSQTTGVNTMYAAVRVRKGEVRYARMALPLTVVEERVGAVRRLALAGLGAGLLAALVATAVASRLLNRRLRIVAETARRYTAGDFSRPARDYGQDEIGAVASVLDNTARELGARLAEMAQARAHTDAILTGMVEGVLLVDRDARLVLTNPAMRAMLHLSAAPEGLHYLEVVRQPDIASMIAAALDSRPTTPVEVEFDREPKRRVMANVVPVKSDRGDGAVLVLHDITDLRHADQVRRDFVANVSHELRTPLTAIRGYVEALLDAPPGPEQSRQFLEVISRHAVRMERLVRDLLRLARLDAGQETLERAGCSIAEIIAAVTDDSVPPDRGTVAGGAARHRGRRQRRPR